MRTKKTTVKEKIVRNGYDKIAEEYHAHRNIFNSRDLLKNFSTYLSDNAIVLDAGCGAGVPCLSSLAKMGFEVIGADFSKNMLQIAKRNVQEAHLIKGDIICLGFRNDVFDGLIAFYSIIHVPREEHFSLFQSFHEVLKPNAVMLICMGPDKWEGVDEYFGAKMFWSHYSSEESLKMLKKAGFEVISSKLLVIGGERQNWIFCRNRK